MFSSADGIVHIRRKRLARIAVVLFLMLFLKSVCINAFLSIAPRSSTLQSLGCRTSHTCRNAERSILRLTTQSNDSVTIGLPNEAIEVLGKKRKSTKASANGKRQTSRRPQNSSFLEHLYWRNHSDPLLLLYPQIQSNVTTTRLKFTVRGNPLPLRRHRTSQGFVYNPSAKAQESFRQVVQELVYKNSSISDLPLPFFSSDQALVMVIAFSMKRPQHHFKANRRGQGRLRVNAPGRTTHPARTDVDNLAKFVLDSLNGLLYTDDRQIASLHVTKFLDNVDDCQGSTTVLVTTLDDHDLQILLDRAFDLV